MTKKKYNFSMKLDLKTLFRKKGIDKPVGWMMKQGISNDTAHKLLKGKFKRGVPVHHLATICEKLWCTPNDLFVWEPENPANDQPAHPLQVLKPKALPENLKEMIERAPLEKIEAMQKFMKEGGGE